MAAEKFLVLIIYDIVDNKVRSKMVKCLEAYGVRVQKSAFEAMLTQRQCERLMAESSMLINEEEDSLRIYILRNVEHVYTYGVGEYELSDCYIL